MKQTILSLLLFFSVAANAQYNELVLRKNGIAKKRYAEGSTISLQTKLGLQYTGTIYLIQNDSIYFQGDGIHTRDVAIVFKKQKKKHRFIPFNKQAFLYSNLGIPLFTAGLVISGEPFVNSLISGVGLFIFLCCYTMRSNLFSREIKNTGLVINMICRCLIFIHQKNFLRKSSNAILIYKKT